MALTDTACTLVPYFKVHNGKLDEFKAIGEKVVERTKNRNELMFYGVRFAGDIAHSRQGYANAEAILSASGERRPPARAAPRDREPRTDRGARAAPASEIEKLAWPLEGLNPTMFVMETGFRR